MKRFNHALTGFYTWKPFFFQVGERMQWFLFKRSVIITGTSDLTALFKAGDGDLNQSVPLF